MPRPFPRLLVATIVACAAVPLIGSVLPAGEAAQQPDAALVARARAIHERVITMDTHNDINANNFTPECNYTMRLTTQVNLPKMVEGGLDVSFMIVYVGQGALTPEGYDSAYRRAVALFDGVHRLTEVIAPDKIGLALTPDDVRKIAASGRKVAVIGIENAYSMGLDISRVKEFHERGGRYMSLAHNGNSQFADSNSSEATKDFLYGNGLSDLGKQVIAEMNKWGIMVDLSHPSKGANLQAIALSKAPVIASHSAARALANHSRNLDDETLAAIKKNGGVVQTVAFAAYVKVDPPERTAALAALRQEFGITNAGGRGGGGGRGAAGAGAGGAAGAGVGATPPVAIRGAAGADPAAVAAFAAQVQGGRGGGGCSVEAPPTSAPAAGAAAGGTGRGGGGGRGGQNAALEALPADRRAEYDKRLADIDAKWPAAGRATVQDFVNHIDYLVKQVGIDHVGVSSDFDGGGGVTGWNSAAETFNVTLELVKRGYSEAQIAKIWSGNLLRVWGEVEKVAKDIQAGKIK
jgi:membrane dipeptidase